MEGGSSPTKVGVIWTDCGDSTDHFVVENRGKLRNARFILQDGKIGMTQAAVFHCDFNVLGIERSEVNDFERHRLLRTAGNPCLIIARAFCSETRARLSSRSRRRMWLVQSAGRFIVVLY